MPQVDVPIAARAGFLIGVDAKAITAAAKASTIGS